MKMKVIAYCAASFRKSVKLAAGVEPYICPPMWVGIDNLENHDFVYIKLHGMKDQPYWYGDNMVTALSVDDLIGLDLASAVIFVSNCYLPESPMLPALLSTGATIVGGSGPNYGHASRVEGVDLVGKWLRILMGWGMGVDRALILAKARLWMRNRVNRIKGMSGVAMVKADDALGFTVYSSEVVI